MVKEALTPASDVFRLPPALDIAHLEWGNFAGAWSYLPFGRFMLNGTIVATAGTLITVVVSVLGAYAFGRLTFRGRDILFIAFLATLMLPQEVVVIPMFVIIMHLKWVNTYPALIVPWAFTAFGTFLLRQFFLTIPRELDDAAGIDGAGRLRMLRSVIVPMALPAIGVLVVFTFLTYWNSFLWPLIVVNSTDMATVPLGLNMYIGQHSSQWNLLMAASTLSVLPSVVLVIALQRYLVRGIAISGLGGR
jgi:multiple sugar transport system permease protein